MPSELEKGKITFDSGAIDAKIILVRLFLLPKETELIRCSYRNPLFFFRKIYTFPENKIHFFLTKPVLFSLITNPDFPGQNP